MECKSKSKSPNLNKIFKTLKVIDYEYVNGNGIYIMECVVCGKVSKKYASNVLRGEINCDCQKTIRNHNTNGKSREKLYKIYTSIISRTTNPKDKAYKNYGGRGIKMCDEWMKDFQLFYDWCNSNGYKENSKLELDRIDNNGNYEANNCRFVSHSQNNRNKRTNHIIEYQGQSHSLVEWSEILGIPSKRLSERIRCGWNVEKAFTQKTNKE